MSHAEEQRKYKKSLKGQITEKKYHKSEARKLAQKRYRAKHREKVRAYDNKVYQKYRTKVLVLLGGKCKKCGFKNSRALQVDHVNGGGVREAKIIHSSRRYVKAIMESIEKKENKYQLLCANCNWIKRYENNELRKFS